MKNHKRYSRAGHRGGVWLAVGKRRVNQGKKDDSRAFLVAVISLKRGFAEAKSLIAPLLIADRVVSTVKPQHR